MKSRTWVLLTVLLLILSHALSFGNPLNILDLRMQVDATALPLLIQATITGGTPPYVVEYIVDTPLLETISVTATTTSAEWSIPLPTNSMQKVYVSVSDSNGHTIDQKLDVVRSISSGEPFLLDETRYSGALNAGFGSDLKLVRRDDFLLSSDPYLVSAPFDFDTEGEITLEWPAHYLVSLSSLPRLLVTVTAGEEGRLAIRGMCEDYTGRPLGYTYLDAHAERMANVGINAVQFIKTFVMDEETGTQIYDPDFTEDSDEALRTGIGAMKHAGFQVMLRLQIFLNAPWPRSDNLQDRLSPSDWALWFSSFEEIALRYAQIAEETGVDIYAFSDTMQTTYAFDQRYRVLIDQLRSVYSGKLTVMTGPFRERLEAIGFWDALDYVGLNGSLHTGRYVQFDDAIDLELDEVYSIFLREFEEQVLPTAELIGKPILWGEIYYQSVERSTYSASGSPIDQFIQAHDDDEAIQFEPEIDFAEQAKGYSAMLRLMQTYSDLIEGAFCLQWTLEDPLLQWCCSGGSHMIPFSMAEDVFRLWWSSDPLPEAISDNRAPREERIEYEEFSETPYRGLWNLDSFGESKAAWQVSEVGPMAAPINVMDLEYSNPSRDFLRFRYTLNSDTTDYSDYDGVVFVVSAEEPCSVRFEVAFSEWISALSDPYRIESVPSIVRLPFDSFTVPPADVEELCLSADSVDSSDLRAVALRPERGSGRLTIYEVGVYRSR